MNKRIVAGPTADSARADNLATAQASWAGHPNLLAMNGLMTGHTERHAVGHFQPQVWKFGQWLDVVSIERARRAALLAGIAVASVDRASPFRQLIAAELRPQAMRSNAALPIGGILPDLVLPGARSGAVARVVIVSRELSGAELASLAAPGMAHKPARVRAKLSARSVWLHGEGAPANGTDAFETWLPGTSATRWRVAALGAKPLIRIQRVVHFAAGLARLIGKGTLAEVVALDKARCRALAFPGLGEGEPTPAFAEIHRPMIARKSMTAKFVAATLERWVLSGRKDPERQPQPEEIPV